MAARWWWISIRPCPTAFTKEPVIRCRVVCITAVLWSLTACAVAEAKVSVRITPAHPTAVDDLVVRFKTDRKLKPRVHYYFELFVGRNENDTCQGGYTGLSNKRPRKGRTMTMRLRATSGVVSDVTTWCIGTSYLNVYTAKGHVWHKLGPRLAAKRFRVSPVPATDGP